MIYSVSRLKIQKMKQVLKVKKSFSFLYYVLRLNTLIIIEQTPNHYYKLVCTLSHRLMSSNRNWRLVTPAFNIMHWIYFRFLVTRQKFTETKEQMK